MATPEEMMQSMLDNMEEKTGRTMEGWMPLLLESGLEKHGEFVKLLKSEHGVGHGYASFIAQTYRSGGVLATDRDATDLVDTQYVGKEHLRPICDRLIDIARELGSDVEISPKKTCVSLRRSKQFAMIQPSTKTRIDLGLNMGKGLAPNGRLEAAGSMGMASHRVRITDLNEIDDDVVRWMKSAYEGA